jgi:heterodisulfide reductase subunit A-like polyferredoxin
MSPRESKSAAAIAAAAAATEATAAAMRAVWRNDNLNVCTAVVKIVRYSAFEMLSTEHKQQLGVNRHSQCCGLYVHANSTYVLALQDHLNKSI